MTFGPHSVGDHAASAIATGKVRAYRETDYVIEGPPSFRLRVGDCSEPVARLMDLEGVDCCAFVTACNPSGSALDDALNAQRHEELRRQLEARGLTFLPGHGRHPTNGWPPEPSFLVLGVGLDQARASGTRWGQDAIVWVGADAVPSLVLLRSCYADTRRK